MDKVELEKYIENNIYCLDFEVDGIGMTWGISYVRLTIGLKSNFDNIEHFFYSILKSDKNQTSMTVGGPTWEERTNIKEWGINLNIKEIENASLLNFIEGSVKGIVDNSKYWEDENSLDISHLNVTKNYGKCLHITETYSPRHFINSTDIYLTSDSDKYYYFEGHWES